MPATLQAVKSAIVVMNIFSSKPVAVEGAALGTDPPWAVVQSEL